MGKATFWTELDFMVKDTGKRVNVRNNQEDYNLPERFELEYTGADNQAYRPVMIHKPLGSMERF